MIYEYKEYPKWVNGRVVKSREEELSAEGIRKDAGLVHGRGDGREKCEEKGCKDLQLETPGKTSDEKPQEVGQEEKTIYPEKYLGIIIYKNEVKKNYYRCCICRKEFKYKQRFAKHKAMHDVHNGLKDIKEVDFGFNKRTEKITNDTGGIQDVSKELVEETGQN